MKIIKQTLLFFLSIVLLSATGCKKDVTDSTDITASKWKLKSITQTANTTKPDEKKDRYILEFTNDSAFQLNLSVNSSVGEYEIFSKGEIQTNIDATTEICCDNDFDRKLIEAFNAITSYKVLGKTLIFNGSKGEVKFKKD